MDKLCGIPSGTLGTCDLKWGHEGDMHASLGDGFFARQWDAKHRRRQAEVVYTEGRRAGIMDMLAIVQDLGIDLPQWAADRIDELERGARSKETSGG